MPALTGKAPRSPELPGNVLEVTVSGLSGSLKRAIEEQFGYVRVRGEISNYRGPHASGHAYFSLKDDLARLDAVIWRSSLLRLKTRPQDGLEVVATGRITTFPGKSAYQIVVEALEPAGVGALMALLEQRRSRFAAEGLFDEARKRALPFLPRTIGIVTSPNGAVIRDILHRLEDRFPRAVLVWPVKVQGETAAAEVAAAVDGFNALAEGGPIARPDLILIARGGGSLEDLWAFNEEVVVRAAAASAIPIVSAIGHETDWTLLDHVADLRAPTPTGAAEKAVPVRSQLLGMLSDFAKRHDAAGRRLLDAHRAALRAHARMLPAAERILEEPVQRLDRARSRLGKAIASLRDRLHLDLARRANRLSRHAPRTLMAERTRDLSLLAGRLTHGLERSRDGWKRRRDMAAGRLARSSELLRRDLSRQQVEMAKLSAALLTATRATMRRRSEALDRHAQLLASLGYRNTLARGFALVRDTSGRPVRSAGAVADADLLDIEFADGHITVAARSVPALARRATAKASSARIRPADQGSLFRLLEDADHAEPDRSSDL